MIVITTFFFSIHSRAAAFSPSSSCSFLLFPSPAPRTRIILVGRTRVSTLLDLCLLSQHRRLMYVFLWKGLVEEEGLRGGYVTTPLVAEGSRRKKGVIITHPEPEVASSSLLSSGSCSSTRDGFFFFWSAAVVVSDNNGSSSSILLHLLPPWSKEKKSLRLPSFFPFVTGIFLPQASRRLMTRIFLLRWAERRA